MPYAKPLSKEQENLIATLYAKNISCREIAVRLGLSKDFEGRRIKRVLRKLGCFVKGKQPLRRKSKCALIDTFFSAITTETQSYWLGFIAADGCVVEDKRKRMYLKVHLHKKDAEHLKSLQRALGSTHKLFFNKKAPKCHLQISSRPLCRDLIALGITPRKSKTLEFPKISPELVSHFIRGVFDGDGCVSVRQKRLTFQFLGTNSVVEGIKKAVGVEANILTIKRCKSLRYFSASSYADVRHIGSYLYRGASVWLPRKRKKFQDFIKDLTA